MTTAMPIANHGERGSLNQNVDEVVELEEGRCVHRQHRDDQNAEGEADQRANYPETNLGSSPLRLS